MVKLSEKKSVVVSMASLRLGTFPPASPALKLVVKLAMEREIKKAEQDAYRALFGGESPTWSSSPEKNTDGLRSICCLDYV